MKIDVHAHYMPAKFFGADGNLQIRRSGSDPVIYSGPRGADTGDLQWNLEARLEVMRRQGVDMHVLSSPPGGFYALDPELALQVCAAVNDGLAETVRSAPERYVAIANLPMQAPELAARELERAVMEMGLRGAMISTHIQGRNLDDPAFAPVWQKMVELDVPFFIHPSGVIGQGQGRLDSYFLDNLIGNPTEDAIAAASLIFGGVVAAYPGIKFYIAHGGGSCPYLCGRWDRGWEARADVRAKIPETRPSEYLRSLYFDSLVLSAAALRYLIDTVGADHVLLGTDYPFLRGVADNDPVKSIESVPGLSAEERELIFSGNAIRLFNLPVEARA